MRIRDFNSNDFGSIESIYNLSKLDELYFENVKYELLPLSKDKTRLSSLLESEILVYEKDSILGFGAYFGSEIRALFVDPVCRGQGIGSTLLNYMLGCVVHPATLYVAKTNEPAKALYSRYGFQIVDEFNTSYNGIPVLANKMLRSGVCG